MIRVRITPELICDMLQQGHLIKQVLVEKGLPSSAQLINARYVKESG